MSTPIKMLIVEDREDDVMLVVHELSRNDFEVQHLQVSNANEMQAALENQSWDIIISDYTMPTFNGIEALGILRQKDNETPFIFVSGTIGEEVAVSAMKAGANNYILKKNLKPLIPVIRREIQDTRIRKEYKKAINSLRQSEEKFRQAFDHSGIGIALLQIDGRFTQVNQTLCDMLEFSKEEMLKQNHFSFIPHEEDKLKIKSVLDTMPSQKNSALKEEIRYKNHSGHDIWVRLTLSTVCNDNGVLLYYIAQVENIQMRKMAETQLSYLVSHDRLTGLESREKLASGIDSAITLAKEKEVNIGILCIDLDRFKLINHALGHDVGDIFLQIVAKKLQALLARDGSIARIGGDEFIIIIENINDAKEIIGMAESILQLFTKPLVSQKIEAFVTASIGISLYPKDGHDSITLLKNADAALGLAKEHGGNTYRFCSAELPKEISDKLNLINELRAAVVQKQFIVYYQPIIHLESGKIASLEALVRWEKSENEIISPLKFIPLAEETGLIVEIGELVLRDVCKNIKEWLLSKKLISIAVNLSPRQMHGKNLFEKIIKIFQEHTAALEHLELEITESILVKSLKDDWKPLAELKELGIKIAIDDFGTGYSSLNYLHELNVDKIKIDKSFIDGLPSNSDSATICRTIIAMAHAMNIKVVAEGVEHQEQLDFLKKHHCDEVQGYYFSRPVEQEKVNSLLDGFGIFHEK